MNDYKYNLRFGASPQIMENANALRKRMTPMEDLLWRNLRNRKLGGYKFRRQHPVDVFIADFYCHEKRIIIEIDGGIHLTEIQKEYDENRTEELERMDIITLRFTNDEIENNMSNVLQKIKNTCNDRKTF